MSVRRSPKKHNAAKKSLHQLDEGLCEIHARGWVGEDKTMNKKSKKKKEKEEEDYEEKDGGRSKEKKKRGKKEEETKSRRVNQIFHPHVDKCVVAR